MLTVLWSFAAPIATGNAAGISWTRVSASAGM